MTWKPRTFPINRWDGIREGKSFGKIVDLSAGGVRVRTEQVQREDRQPDSRPPGAAGVCGHRSVRRRRRQRPEPKTEWIGWMTVKRVISLEPGKFEIAGQADGHG